jgi:hypothetical protein
VTGLKKPWEPRQRLIDAIGPYYRERLFKARDRARARVGDLDEEELAQLASDGRTIANSLDEAGAQMGIRRGWRSTLRVPSGATCAWP